MSFHVSLFPSLIWAKRTLNVFDLIMHKLHMATQVVFIRGLEIALRTPEIHHLFVDKIEVSLEARFEQKFFITGTALQAFSPFMDFFNVVNGIALVL